MYDLAQLGPIRLGSLMTSWYQLSTQHMPTYCRKSDVVNTVNSINVLVHLIAKKLYNFYKFL